jgi:quinol monooxygenase YgiN
VNRGNEDDMITVVAHYRTRPGTTGQVRDLLRRHAAASEAEDGCQMFHAHQAVEDPTVFALYEMYDSKEAFAAHRASEHFRVNIEQTLVPLLIERDWTVFSERL